MNFRNKYIIVYKNIIQIFRLITKIKIAKRFPLTMHSPLIVIE